MWFAFVNNLWYPPFILMGSWICGFSYLDNGTEKYVNEYWHSSSIYVVVKESNLPKGHSPSSHLSQTCLGRENSMANPSKSMKAHWNFAASNKHISCTIKVRWKLICIRNDASHIVRSECLFQTCNLSMKIVEYKLILILLEWMWCLVAPKHTPFLSNSIVSAQPL